MQRLIVTAMLLAVAPGWAGAQTAPRLSADPAADEQTLKAIPLTTTGAGLVDFFRKRADPRVNETVIRDAVKQLNSQEAETQARGAEELVKIGHPAVPALRQVVNSLDDADAAVRARRCLTAIEGDAGVSVCLAAARLLAGQPATEGAVEALLAYLPYADDREETARELETCLVLLAVRDGKVDKGLLAALKDSAPARRSFAARVICQAGTPEQRQAVLPLLKDPRPTVRYNAALGLAQKQDGEAIPVLIDLLAELPPTQRQSTEDFLTELAGDWNVIVPKGSDRFTTKLRREVWLAWWKATEGTALIEELKDRTLSEDDRKKVEELIGKLIAEKAEERESASAALIKHGKNAAGLLRRASLSPNNKLSEAAGKCLNVIDQATGDQLPVAALRLLALRKPDGAAEALLGYLPFADSEELSSEARTALEAVALRDGKAEPTLVKALSDPVKVRRIAAAEALAFVASERDAVRKLLKDDDQEVRLRAALGLANAGDREAVPALIASLTDAPAELAWKAEEYLSLVAGPKRPETSLGSDAESRKKARAAWEEWWKTSGDQVRLVRSETGSRLLGYTLVVEQYGRTGQGRVLELDASGKVRWEVKGLNYPLDAQYLPGDRILIAEQNLNRVTERDLRGTIVWQKQVNQPFICQRLRNGHTFIANRNQLFEVDKTGKEAMRIDRFSDYFYAAARTRDGNYAFVNSAWTYAKIDRTGKVLKSWQLPPDTTGSGRYLSINENGNVMLSEYGLSKVVELNAEDGKEVWQAKVTWPNMPEKLSNGNVLVVVTNQQKIVELDRNGKTVREIKDATLRPWRAYRR